MVQLGRAGGFNFLAILVRFRVGAESSAACYWCCVKHDIFCFAEWNIFIPSFKVCVNKVANNIVVEFI